MTDFSSKCRILGELWLEYRNHPKLEAYTSFNDMGLPLAYFISENIVSNISDEGKQLVEETYNLLLNELDITDEGFVELAELFELAEEINSISI